MAKFLEENNGETVTNDNFHKITTYSIDACLALLGCLNNGTLLDITRDNLFISGQYPKVNASIYSGFLDLCRSINFENGTIDNQLFELDPTLRRQGIGTRILDTQIKYAKQMHFSQISIYAAGSAENFNIDGQIGYYVWGRLGFSMQNPEHERMINFFNQLGMEHIQNMQDLMNDKEVRALWLNHFGFPWHGQFDLLNDLPNINHFNKYKLEYTMY